MSKREIAIKATHMCLSFLSLMGSSKTKAKPLNCASDPGGSWSHVRKQLRVVAPALAHGKCTAWARLCSYLFLGVCCDCTSASVLGLLWGPKQAAQPGAGAKPGGARGCIYLRYGAPSSAGYPNSAGNWKRPAPFLHARQANLSRADLVSF